MFIPVPVIVVIGLILILMIAQIARLSRRRDPLLGGFAPIPRPSPVAGREGLPVAPTVTLPPEVESQVRELIGRRRKIEAIKLVREVTHLGLKESRDLVEAL